MIETLAKIWMIFGSIVAIGLVLAWLNDSLEALWHKTHKPAGLAQHSSSVMAKSNFVLKPSLFAEPSQRVIVYQVPLAQQTSAHLTQDQDFAHKIMRIDFSQGRPVKKNDELGPHVRVLSKAA
jgi:hypothetical protein